MTDTIRLSSIGGFTPQHSALSVKVLTDISTIDDFLAELKGAADKGEFFKKHGYTLVKIDDDFCTDCCSLSSDELDDFDGFLNEVTFPFDFQWVKDAPHKHWDWLGNEISTVSGWLFVPIHTHPDAVGVYQINLTRSNTAC